MPSTVPDAQDELVALLQAALPDTTHVQFGLPATVPKKKWQRVYVLNETGYVRGGGEQWREESYRLRLAVEVYEPGNNQKAAEDKRWALIDAIDDALVDDDFYGYGTERGRMTTDPATVAWDKGYLAKAILEISILGRE